MGFFLDHYHKDFVAQTLHDSDSKLIPLKKTNPPGREGLFFC